MVTREQDRREMDEEYRELLKEQLPRPAGATKGYSLLETSIDTIWETKKRATDADVRVPGLETLLDSLYE